MSGLDLVLRRDIVDRESRKIIAPVVERVVEVVFSGRRDNPIEGSVNSENK